MVVVFDTGESVAGCEIPEDVPPAVSPRAPVVDVPLVVPVVPVVPLVPVVPEVLDPLLDAPVLEAPLVPLVPPPDVPLPAAAPDDSVPVVALAGIVDEGAGLDELCVAPVCASFGVAGGAEAATLELLPGLRAATPLPPLPAPEVPSLVPPAVPPPADDPPALPDPDAPLAPAVDPEPPVPLVALEVPEYATWIGRFAIEAWSNTSPRTSICVSRPG
jgi:hypothetical protein